ncbi:MAG: hypothetical protein DK306_002153 [Chloroflexi bacterium]|nr:MAG: hypothetical protein DK306_002153 [Chloroflexota bacterium]
MPPQLALGEADAVYRRALARALESGDAGALPIFFRAQVLIALLQRQGAKLLRTDTIGRLLAPGKPTLDFGLVDQDRLLHLRFRDLAELVPERDREHWLAHLVAPPHSRVLLQMQAHPGSCHDDGPIREWALPPTDAPPHTDTPPRPASPN